MFQPNVIANRIVWGFEGKQKRVAFSDEWKIIQLVIGREQFTGIIRLETLGPLFYNKWPQNNSNSMT